jgi:hypothetical protein
MEIAAYTPGLIPKKIIYTFQEQESLTRALLLLRNDF